ncbi:flavin reductase family protein [Nocardiopsis nanhaiensis]
MGERTHPVCGTKAPATGTRAAGGAVARGPIGPDEFKDVFRRHPAGVAVITFATEDGPRGFTATSVISVSADPPVLAFSVAGGTSAHALLQLVPSVAVHFLADSQAALAGRFAARGTDRFAGSGWSVLPTGEPVLPGTVSWLRGPIVGRFRVGDSLLTAVEVHDAGSPEGGSPLVYEGRTFRVLGGPVRG